MKMSTPVHATRTSVERPFPITASIDRIEPLQQSLSHLVLRSLAVVLLALVAGNAARASVADDQKTVAALDTRYQAAVKQNDAAQMDLILADDFVLVTGSGKTYSKHDLLEEARGQRIQYELQDDTEKTVRVWGDTAVVTAKLRAKGTEDGKAFDYEVWFSDVYLRTSAGWRYAFAQSSLRLPSRPQ